MNARILYIAFVLCALALGDEIKQSSHNAPPPDTQDKNQVENKKDLQKVKLDKVTATAEREFEAYQSGNQIGREMLDSNPSGNGDITSILKILPNVQFDNSQLKSTTPGEIDPANVSISGGLFYQNNFQLDGFTMNNDLDPANGSSYTETTALPGRSQGLNIDTSLLESITVQDSNVSAAYGGFTGGVVEANTRRPIKKYGGNISYQISQGNAKRNAFSLTNYHIHEANDNSYNEFLNSTSAGNQPEFIKHSIRSSVESKFNDKSGIIASFTTMQSFIPLNAYASTQIGTTLDSTRKTQKRQSYNFFVKGHYDPLSNLRLELSYAYAPQYNEYFIVNTKDSDFFLQSGGHQGGLKAIWENALGIFTAQSSINYMENSRSGSAQHMRGWRFSDEKNWNPIGYMAEGGYGNVNSTQLGANLKFNQVFNPVEVFGFLENIFSAGLESGYVNAYYERLRDTIFSGYAFTRKLNAGETCVETFWCSNAVVDITKIPTAQQNQWANNNGQYMYRATLYKAGKINLNNTTLALFAEDDIKFDLSRGGKINTRFGLRLDYDTYMNKATFAPRFSFNYITPAPKSWQTQITFGANRYYGRNLFAYALMDGRSSLQYTINNRAYNQSWYEATATQNKNDTNFRELKVPYSDELMIGVLQNIKALSLNLKYIYRQGKDEIRRSCKNPQTGEISALNCSSNINVGTINTSILRYIYTNDGASISDVVSLSLQNNSPLDTFGIKHFYLFAADWTGVKRNYADYSDILSGAEYANDFISYDGVLMRYADKPATNFARPYTLRLNTTHSFSIARTKWLLTNFFRYRSSYNVMASVTREADKDSFIINGTMTKVDTFKKFRVPGAFTWDMRVGFEVNVWKDTILYVNVDIYNVLDSKNLAIASASYSASAGTTAVPVYEVGRQFWLQVGCKF